MPRPCSPLTAPQFLARLQQLQALADPERHANIDLTFRTTATRRVDEKGRLLVDSERYQKEEARYWRDYWRAAPVPLQATLTLLRQANAMVTVLSWLEAAALERHVLRQESGGG